MMTVVRKVLVWAALLALVLTGAIACESDEPAATGQAQPKSRISSRPPSLGATS